MESLQLLDIPTIRDKYTASHNVSFSVWNSFTINSGKVNYYKCVLVGIVLCDYYKFNIFHDKLGKSKLLKMCFSMNSVM